MELIECAFVMVHVRRLGTFISVFANVDLLPHLTNIFPISCGH